MKTGASGSTDEPRRLAPTAGTLRQLFALSGNRCAFAGCEHPLINAAGLFVAETCHVAAAMPEGPRFDASMTNDDRRAATNLLLLCHRHHREVDHDVSHFTVSRLLQIKARHEARFAETDSVSEGVFQGAVGAMVESALRGASSRLRTPQEFFAESDAPGRLVRHDLPLVGRETQLGEIVAAASAPAARIIVVTGRGGIGKTRLLREAARLIERDRVSVLFAADPSLLGAEVLADLPAGETVVFVDDAHRVDADLTQLFAAAGKAAPAPLTVVVACRPAGLDAIRETVARAGLEAADVCETSPLARLPSEETLALARAALGRSLGAERLAAASAEIPLIAVVGGRLIAAGAFDDDDAAGAEQLRREVMHRFAAELQGRVTPRVAPDLARELLVLVAALEPLDVGDPEVMKLVADELGVKVSQLRTSLGELQFAGLLQQRGTLRRIVPEMLSDAVLEDACFDRQPRPEPTGRAQELWQRYRACAATSLLVNLGSLDWKSEAAGSIVDDIWAELAREFADADALGRRRLIELLAPAAVFAPTQVLALADIELADPAAPSQMPFVDLGPESVRECLPRLLAQVGRHAEHARAAMERLWVLGRDDTRPTHSHPDHALRVLRNLGGYEMQAPHHQALLDLIADRSADSDVADHAILPIELVDAVLAREGERIRENGARSITIGRYFIHTESTELWRSQARALLLLESAQPTPRRQVAAAAVFEDALRLAYGGDKVAGSVLNEWRVDQLRLLETARQIAAAGTVPAARVRLSRAISPYADDEPWDDVRGVAREICERLGGEREEILTTLAAPWDILDDNERLDRDRRVATAIASSCTNGSDLGVQLDDLFNELVISGLSDRPSAQGPVARLLDRNPEFADGLWTWCEQHAESAVASDVGSIALSAAVSREGSDSALSAASQSEHVVLRRNAAERLCARAGREHLTDTERSLLRTFSSDADEQVRHVTGIALLRLGQQDPLLACTLALEPAWDTVEHRTADLLLGLVADVGIQHLDTQSMDRLVTRLITTSRAEHFAHAVLEQLGRHEARLVIAVWLGRLRRTPNTELDRRASPVPFHDYGVEMLGDADGAERVALARELLSAASTLSPISRRDLGRLYWRTAVPGLADDKPDDVRCDAAAPAVEAAWKAWLELASDGDGDADNLADVLCEAPWQLVVRAPDTVRAVLANEPPDEPGVFARALSTAVRSGSFGRTLGSDSPRWASTATHARSAADRLTSGSPAQLLFATWAEIAEREIEGERREDEIDRAGWHA